MRSNVNNNMLDILNLITISLTGMLVGNEFAVAAFIHPALVHLPPIHHLSAASRIAARLGKVMPFWYSLCLILLGLEAWAHRHQPQAFAMLLAASALWAATILVTVLFLVPRNNRIASANPADPHPGWQRDRSTWDALHRLRVVAVAVAFILLLLSTLRAGIHPL